MHCDTKPLQHFKFKKDLIQSSSQSLTKRHLHYIFIIHPSNQTSETQLYPTTIRITLAMNYLASQNTIPHLPLKWGNSSFKVKGVKLNRRRWVTWLGRIKMNGGVSLSHCRWSLKDRCSLFRHEHAPFLILEWCRKILFFLIGIQSNVMRNAYCLETEAQGKS